MSVQVPTAERTPPEPPPPTRRPPRWVVVMVGLVVASWVIGVAVTGDEDSPEIVAEIEPTNQPSLRVDQWHPTLFPGAGTFVDVASEGGRTIAVVHEGTDWSEEPRGSALWARSAPGNTWEWVEIATPGEWTILSVAMSGDTVLAGGALDVGLPAAAVWFGTLGQPLELIDSPLDEPGRVELVRTFGDQTVVVVRLTTRFADPSPAAPEGVSRVLSRRPGGWADITPPGDEVVITSIIDRGLEWLAVGQDGDGAAAWSSADEGRTWIRTTVVTAGRALLTGLTVFDDQAYAVALLTDEPAMTIQLLAYTETGWTAVGEPRARNVAWIAPLQGELVGGPASASQQGGLIHFLWRHLGGGEWSVIEMTQPEGASDGWPTAFTAAADGIVVGTALGQPAMWQPTEAASPLVAPATADPQWERVGPIPGDILYVASTDNALYAITYTPGDSQATAFTSTDGKRWDPLDLPQGIALAALQPVGDQVVVVGYTEMNLVLSVSEGGGFRTLARLEGRLQGLTGDESSINVYVALAGQGRRFHISLESGATTEHALAWTPHFIQPIDEQLIVAGTSETPMWPPTALQVSVDDGRTWESLDIEFWGWYRVGDELIVLGTDETTYRLQTDGHLRLDPVDLPEPFDTDDAARPLFEWGDRLAAHDGKGRVYVLNDLDSAPEVIEVSVANGFNGIFGYPAGPEHVVASEAGRPVLYRWTGTD